MRIEKVLGCVVTIIATLAIIFGLSTDIIWGYELACLTLGLSFIFLYKREEFRPRSKGFNFVISYLGLAICIGLGRFMMTANIYGIIAVLISISTLLCILTAYVPVIAFQLGYRSKNKPHFPEKTLVLFVLTTLLIAILQ